MIDTRALTRMRNTLQQQQQPEPDDPMELLRRQQMVRGQAAQAPSSLLAQAMQDNGRMQGGMPAQNPGAPSDKLAMRQNAR